MADNHRCDYPKFNHYGKCIADCIYNSGDRDCAGVERQKFRHDGREVQASMGFLDSTPTPMSTPESRQALVDRIYGKDSTEMGV